MVAYAITKATEFKRKSIFLKELLIMFIEEKKISLMWISLMFQFHASWSILKLLETIYSTFSPLHEPVFLFDKVIYKFLCTKVNF